MGSLQGPLRFNGGGWRGLTLAMMMSVILLIGHAAPTSTIEAACNIEAGSVKANQAGAEQKNLSNLVGVSGLLWNYNPDPVFSRSSFWVMVHNDLPHPDGRWAQIGWLKFFWEAQPVVFLQVSTDEPPTSETLITRYYHPDGTWKEDPEGAVVPHSEKQYEVFKYGTTWVFNYDFGEYFTTDGNINWLPNTVAVSGETDLYEAVTGGIDKGDHFPGHNGPNFNKIQANNVKKNISGIWSDTNLAKAEDWGPSNGDSDLDNWNGDGARVWDVRCDS